MFTYGSNSTEILNLWKWEVVSVPEHSLVNVYYPTKCLWDRELKFTSLFSQSELTITKLPNGI